MGGKKSTVTQQQLPRYAKPYFMGVLQSGAAESKRPYVDYEGDRMAGLTPDEIEAQSAVRDIYRQGDIPEMGQAAGMLGRASEVSASPRMWGKDAYKQYASPFFEEVIDIEKESAARQAAKENVTSALGSAGRGTLGGYRSGIMAAERERNLGEQLHNIEATGRQRAWDSARAAFLDDEGRRQMAAQQQASLAGQIADLGMSRRQQSMDRISALEQVGMGQRELQQAAMDMAYQDWIEEQNWGKQQLGFMNEILRGLPTGANTRQVLPGPSTGQLVAGGVTAGLGGLLQGYDMYSRRNPSPPNMSQTGGVPAPVGQYGPMRADGSWASGGSVGIRAITN